MLGKYRPRSVYDVMAAIGCFAAIATGGAYAANTVGSADIIDESILSQDIKNGEVTSSDLAANSVTSSRIQDGQVFSPELGGGSVNSTKIADGSIATSDIGAGQVTASRIADGSINNAKIGPNAVSNAKLNDNTVSTSKIQNNAVTHAKLGNDSVTTDNVLDDTAGGGLNTQDINPLNGDADIIDNTITTFDIATNAIDSDEVLDFGLSNEDVGVLFAQINSDGSTFNSSGGVTSFSLGTGVYEVDFGRDISQCGFTATQGEGGIGGAGGAIMGVTDRSGNANAIFATSRDAAGALVNTAFQVTVVC